jgi:three-Cys-motif partner protein
MSIGDHEFGGQHTDIKLSIVEKYLKRYSAALHTWCNDVWYIDAFAGTGNRTVRVKARGGDLFEESTPEYIEQRRGSAKIAIDIEPKFDRLVFMDVKPKHVAALEVLRDENPGRSITVLQGDSNALIRAEIEAQDWRRTRAVMFLDPYGMEVEWATLTAIASTRAIDVWYLFPLAGLFRQAARSMEKVDDSKSRAITRMLGTDVWRDELYSAAPAMADLLTGMEPPETRQRNANVAGLEQYVRERLRTLFSEVLDPFPLPPVERPQRFSLFCAISNPSPKAISLANEFGSSIVKSLTHKPASRHRSVR